MRSDRTVRLGERLPSSSWLLGPGFPEPRLRPETNVSTGPVSYRQVTSQNPLIETGFAWLGLPGRADGWGKP